MVRIAFVSLVLASFMWIGCGADDPDFAANPSVKPLKEMSADERTAELARRDRMVHASYSWPEGKPGNPDVMTDLDACQKIREKDPALANAHPVKQMIADARCMADKGWIFDAEAAKAAE